MDNHQPPVPLSRGARGARTLLAAVITAAFAFLFLVPPEQWSAFACPFKEETGYSCFTCGLTRSLHAILHGALWRAVEYHAMGPVVFLLGVGFCILFGYEAIVGRRFPLLPGPPVLRRSTQLIAASWSVFWIIRLAVELHLFS
jgi:hypothetical protein